MNTYNIPRNVKGEGRILFIFSTKALMYTAVGAGIGMIFYFFLNLLNLALVGYVIIGVLGLIGFIIGTFKMPDSKAFSLTRDTGGENIDDVIKRFVKFKMEKNKIYVSTIEEKNKEKEEEK